jgi:hypothetical protein
MIGMVRRPTSIKIRNSVGTPQFLPVSKMGPTGEVILADRKAV